MTKKVTRQFKSRIKKHKFCKLCSKQTKGKKVKILVLVFEKFI